MLQRYLVGLSLLHILYAMFMDITTIHANKPITTCLISVILQIEDLSQQAQQQAAEKFKAAPEPVSTQPASSVAATIEEASDEEEVNTNYLTNSLCPDFQCLLLFCCLS